MGLPRRRANAGSGLPKRAAARVRVANEAQRRGRPRPTDELPDEEAYAPADATAGPAQDEPADPGADDRCARGAGVPPPEADGPGDTRGHPLHVAHRPPRGRGRVRQHHRTGARVPARAAPPEGRAGEDDTAPGPGAGPGARGRGPPRRAGPVHLLQAAEPRAGAGGWHGGRIVRGVQRTERLHDREAGESRPDASSRAQPASGATIPRRGSPDPSVCHSPAALRLLLLPVRGWPGRRLRRWHGRGLPLARRHAAHDGRAGNAAANWHAAHDRSERSQRPPSYGRRAAEARVSLDLPDR
mmetsp:Transcript_4731/g.10564  ORF Transcript_4731/g.10564 Transcript_4731/m.10564 type:complete len:299 (+) Transcript_4731:342-1238(+)